MKFRIFTIVAFAVFIVSITTSPQFAHAQTKNVPLKIATVNIDELRAKADASQKINEQLLKIQNQINSELQAEEKALREANAELARKRTLLAPEAFAAERKKYEQRVVAFQRKRQESQNLMNQKVADATNQLSRKIIEIITRYAEENQVTLVLPLSATILAADAFNISAHVLTVLNKELPTVTISMPAK